jgi:hypothetical protein
VLRDLSVCYCEEKTSTNLLAGEAEFWRSAQILSEIFQATLLGGGGGAEELTEFYIK